MYCQNKTKQELLKEKQDSIKSLSSEEITKILDKKNYLSYDSDVSWMNVASKRYSLSTSQPRKLLLFIAEKDSFNRHINRIRIRYNIYWLTHEIKMYEKLEEEKTYTSLSNYLVTGQKTMEESNKKELLSTYTDEPQDHVKAIKKYLSDARTESDEYKRNRKVMPSSFNPNSYYKDRIPDLIAKAELTLLYFEKKVGSTDMMYLKLLEEKNTVAIEMKKDALVAYAEIKPPLDKYTGSDAASNKALIMQSLKTDYPEEKFLKVYLTGTKWEKDEGYNYSFSSSNAAQTVRSESNLDAAVAIENKENPKTCYIFFGKINKDNSTGKKVVLFSIDHYKEQAIDEVFIEKVIKK